MENTVFFRLFKGPEAGSLVRCCGNTKIPDALTGQEMLSCSSGPIRMLGLSTPPQHRTNDPGSVIRFHVISSRRYKLIRLMIKKSIKKKVISGYRWFGGDVNASFPYYQSGASNTATSGYMQQGSTSTWFPFMKKTTTKLSKRSRSRWWAWEPNIEDNCQIHGYFFVEG